MTLSMVLLIGASPFIGSTTGTRRRSRGLRADWCRAAESRRGRNIRPGSSGVQRVTRSSTAQRARGADDRESLPKIPRVNGVAAQPGRPAAWIARIWPQAKANCSSLRIIGVRAFS